MKNRPIQTKQEPAMGYEAFKRALQDKIQDCVARPVNFMETESVRINETSEGLILKLDGGNTAPLIYPEKLYEDYLAGMPLSMIAADAADIARKTCEYSEIPKLTPENAQKSIRLALINKEQNRKLLETCPYPGFGRIILKNFFGRVSHLYGRKRNQKFFRPKRPDVSMGR